MNTAFTLPPEMVRTYLLRRYSDVVEIKDSALDLGVLTHNLKGNAVTFGFPTLQNIAEEVDSGLEANKPIHDLKMSLLTEIERLIAAYNIQLTSEDSQKI